MGKMIDSNIEWLGEIPAGWRLVKAKYLFQEEKARGNGNCVQLLSPTQKYGVIPQALYQEITGMMPTQVSETADLNTFKTIHNGDFCISLSSYMGALNTQHMKAWFLQHIRFFVKKLMCYWIMCITSCYSRA